MNSSNPSETLPGLTKAEQARYSRHLVLPEIGSDGQLRLKAGRVLVVGAGGLGSASAMYLAAAGVGTIGIVDFDTIDLSNLQRQILHSTADVGTSKCQSAKARLNQINPEIHIVMHEERLTSSNIERIIESYDLVIDGTDNFQTRYLINDACVLQKKPNVYGAIYRFEGQASVFAPGGPCYRCLFPAPPAKDSIPNCAEGGVLGVLAGLIGVVQATEALKWITGTGSSLSGRLLTYNALDMEFTTLKLARNDECPVCGDHPTITLVTDSIATSCSSNGQDSDLLPIEQIELIAAVDLNHLLGEGASNLLLLDVRNPEEYDLCHLPNSLLIPLRELPARMQEIAQDREVIIYCKTGGRSLSAYQLLAKNGWQHLKNLKGGILAWIDEVDPTMARY